MVYPPASNEEPTVKDTKIDQSILGELFEVEQINKYTGILDQTSGAITNRVIDENVSIEDFEEEEEDSEIEDIEYADLPDLSEYEEMIDWDEPPDAENLTEGEKKFYNSTQDIDITDV